MPTTSEKQRKLMQAVKHDPKMRKKMGMSKADAEKMLSHGKGKPKPKHRGKGK